MAVNVNWKLWITTQFVVVLGRINRSYVFTIFINRRKKRKVLHKVRVATESLKYTLFTFLCCFHLLASLLLAARAWRRDSRVFHLAATPTSKTTTSATSVKKLSQTNVCFAGNNMSGGNKAIELQLQMRQNAEDMHSFMRELEGWEKDIKKKDEELRTGGLQESQVCSCCGASFHLRSR